MTIIRKCARSGCGLLCKMEKNKLLLAIFTTELAALGVFYCALERMPREERVINIDGILAAASRVVSLCCCCSSCLKTA
jgi:hypothetical protein